MPKLLKIFILLLLSSCVQTPSQTPGEQTPSQTTPQVEQTPSQAIPVEQCAAPVHKSLASNQKTVEQLQKNIFSVQSNNLYTDNADLKSLYDSQWKLGKLLAQQGNLIRAIDAYQLAVQHLKRLREIGGGSDKPSQQTLEKVHYELVDLLLKQVAAEKVSENEQQSLLNQVIETLELLKQAELQNYFKDECLISDEKRLDNKLMTEFEKLNSSEVMQTAILYPILFPKHLGLTHRQIESLLIKFSPKSEHSSTLQKKIIWQPTQTNIDIEEKANCLRDALENEGKRLETLQCKAGKNTYYNEQDIQGFGKTLYQFIIQPIENDLNNIKTLVFVPDGILRTIPLTTLYDGQQYVVEKDYAVVIIPGLSLTKAVTNPLTKNPRILLGGMSTQVHDVVLKSTNQKINFRSLSLTENGLNSIAAIYPGQTQIRLNEQFLISNLKSDMRDALQPYTMIHLHTHGLFNPQKEDTFLLTYDMELNEQDRLTMKRLEGIFGIGQLRGYPIELLTLSACQTAMGDSQAALGLAGVAFKSGARSVLATLWNADEPRAAELMRRFYQLLQTSSSKAQALQTAQQQMLDIIVVKPKDIEKKCDSSKEIKTIVIKKQNGKQKEKVICNRKADGDRMMANHWATFILIGNWFSY